MVDSPAHTRRTFVGVSAAVVAGVAVGGCGGFSDAQRLAGFVSLSRVVTGVDDLPRRHAAAYLRALRGAELTMTPTELAEAAGYVGGDGPRTIDALMASPALKQPGAEACARAVAGAWWSGMVTDRWKHTRVITYDDALVFRAMRYARPQAQCLGATGAWSKRTPVAPA